MHFLLFLFSVRNLTTPLILLIILRIETWTKTKKVEAKQSITAAVSWFLELFINNLAILLDSDKKYKESL